MSWNPTEQRREKRELRVALGRAKVQLHNIGIKIARTSRTNSRRLERLYRRVNQLSDIIGRNEANRQLSRSLCEREGG